MDQIKIGRFVAELRKQKGLDAGSAGRTPGGY